MLAFLSVTTFIVPFIFFLSLAGDQAVLPGAGGYPYSSPQSTPGNGGSVGEKKRRGFALRLFDILRRKRDEVLPDVIGRYAGPSTGLLPKEKI